jgi:hypothetical protein
MPKAVSGRFSSPHQLRFCGRFATIFIGYHEVHARLDFQPNELFAYLSRPGHKFAALGRADQSGLKDTQRVSPNNEISGN